MRQRWYITFHGGEPSTAHRHGTQDSPDDHCVTWNNIHVFDLNGRPLGKALDAHSLPEGLGLRELRGFAFGPAGDLYVANAYRDASQILRFAGEPNADGRHVFREVYVEQHKTNPGLAHPFVVGRYYGPASREGTPGAPMPHPAALRDGNTGHLLPGTFVPSVKHAPGGVRTVRRVIFGADGDLYVADRDADSVKRYDGGTGALRCEYRHASLTTPVHLVFRPADGALLVGSRDGDAVLAIDPHSGAVTTLVQPRAGGLRAPGGLAFGPDGALYVCSRDSKQILRFDAHTGVPEPHPFIDDLGDCPEFIVLVAG